MITTQYDLFTGTPPHVRHSSTSQAAAEAIAPKVNALQRQILAVVRQHPLGLTRDQIEELTGLPHTTSSARVRELFLKGLLETRIDPATGQSYRRPTRSGKSAEVCFGVPACASTC
jgi:DNA-binding MarR family transcriptional regulator